MNRIYIRVSEPNFHATYNMQASLYVIRGIFFVCSYSVHIAVTGSTSSLVKISLAAMKQA